MAMMSSKLPGRASVTSLVPVPVPTSNRLILCGGQAGFGTSQHTLPEAFELAREVLASGAALARLRDLARLSGGTDEAIQRWL